MSTCHISRNVITFGNLNFEKPQTNILSPQIAFGYTFHTEKNKCTELRCTRGSLRYSKFTVQKKTQPTPPPEKNHKETKQTNPQNKKHTYVENRGISWCNNN